MQENSRNIQQECLQQVFGENISTGKFIDKIVGQHIIRQKGLIIQIKEFHNVCNRWNLI